MEIRKGSHDGESQSPVEKIQAQPGNFQLYQYLEVASPVSFTRFSFRSSLPRNITLNKKSIAEEISGYSQNIPGIEIYQEAWGLVYLPERKGQKVSITSAPFNRRRYYFGGQIIEVGALDPERSTKLFERHINRVVAIGNEIYPYQDNDRIMPRADMATLPAPSSIVERCEGFRIHSCVEFVSEASREEWDKMEIKPLHPIPQREDLLQRTPEELAQENPDISNFTVFDQVRGQIVVDGQKIAVGSGGINERNIYVNLDDIVTPEEFLQKYPKWDFLRGTFSEREEHGIPVERVAVKGDSFTFLDSQDIVISR